MARQQPARQPAAPAGAAYEADTFAWAAEQAALLRAGRFDLIDVQNLADEIDDVGKSERRAVESALIIILLHMLKWDYQPQRRSRSWVNSIAAGRGRFRRDMASNPGLKPHLASMIADAHEDARLLASTETDLPPETFPTTCPWALEEILERPYPWPPVG